MKLILLLTAIALLTGCGLLLAQKHTILLAPNIEAAESKIGQNKKVYLVVLDKRASTELYRPGANWDQRNVISLQPDLAVAVLNGTKQGLTRYGFQVVQESQPGVLKVEIELRALEYQLGIGQWAGKAKALVAARMEVTQGQATTFQKMFSAENQRSLVFDSLSFNTEQINAVVSSLLGQMINNHNLLNALTQ